MPVLVVDDNPTNRCWLDTMLKNWSMRPTLAVDGFEALDILAKQSYPLILLDGHMPGMSGFDVAQQIQEDRRSATVIMLTSSGERGDAKRCQALGIRGYLTKPVSQDDLRTTIRLLLNPNNTAAATEALVTRHTVRELRDSLSILLAEDNVVNQKLTVTILSRRGYHVTVVNNGQEAIDALGAARFDLILMDMQMPVMDGLEASRHIRAMRENSTWPPTPIIALTANAMSGDRERYLQAGLDGYISKPIDTTRTLEEINRVLGLADSSELRLAAQEQDTTPVFDHQQALKNCDDDETFLPLLLAAFIDDMPQRMAELRDGISRGDLAAITMAAHTLKGSCLSIAALRLATQCRRMETAADEGRRADAVASLAELEASCEELLAALRPYLVPA